MGDHGGSFDAVGMRADKFDLKSAVSNAEPFSQRPFDRPLDVLQAVGVDPIDHYMRLEIRRAFIQLPDVQVMHPDDAIADVPHAASAD